MTGGGKRQGQHPLAGCIGYFEVQVVDQRFGCEGRTGRIVPVQQDLKFLYPVRNLEGMGFRVAMPHAAGEVPQVLKGCQGFKGICRPKPIFEIRPRSSEVLCGIEQEGFNERKIRIGSMHLPVLLGQ